MSRALVCTTVDQLTADRIDWLIHRYELTQEQVIDAMAAHAIGALQDNGPDRERALIYWQSISDHFKRERDTALLTIARNGV